MNRSSIIQSLHRSSWGSDWKKYLVLAACLALAGCERCGTKKADPRSHIHRSSEAVFEVNDIGVLAKRHKQLLALTTGIITPAQLDGLKNQMTRWLGFDPTDAAKLKEAGLATEGRAVGSFGERGRDLLWILPVSDEAKFKTTVKAMVETRRRVDATKEEETKSGKITIYSTSWGNETLPVAAVVIKKGLGFVGMGPASSKLVTDAINLKAENSILQHPEYQALDKSLGESQIARLIVPTATVSASQALVGQAQALLPDKKLIQVIKSLGWTFGWEKQKLTVQSRFRLDKKTIQDIQGVLKPIAPRSDIMKQINDSSSVLSVHATGNPQKLIELVTQPDTPIKKEYDALSAMVKTQLGIDLNKDVLSLLNGHAAASARLIDLSSVTNLQAIMQNPAALARYSVAVGIKGKEWEKRLDAILLNFESQLESKGLSRTSKNERGLSVDTVSFNGQMIMESYISDNAWVLSNDDQQLKALIAKKKATVSGGLSNLGGVHATLNIVPLRTALEKVDVGRLSGSGLGGPMVRAAIAKVLQVLARFEKLDAKIEGAPDGVAFKASLSLSELPAQK